MRGPAGEGKTPPAARLIQRSEPVKFTGSSAPDAPPVGEPQGEHEPTDRRGPPPADLRHYQPPGRGQDHAHGEAPALRRGHPPGGEREGAARGAPRHQRLDEDGAGARHLGDQLGAAVRVPGQAGEPAGHAGPRGLLGGHLPHADGGGQRGDAAGQPQGGGGADAAALPGLPPAAHADLHLRQQVRPRGDARAAAAGRRGARPGAEVLPDHLADPGGRPLPGGLRPRRAAHPPLRARGGPRAAPRAGRSVAELDDPAVRGAAGRARRTTSSWRRSSCWTWRGWSSRPRRSWRARSRPRTSGAR